MKKISAAVMWMVLLMSAKAQTPAAVKITGTKFPFEIMQQWIDVYSKSHPSILFQLSKSISTDSAELIIAAHPFRPGELNGDQLLIAVNSYAQLPFVNSSRGDLAALTQKGFTKEDLQDIYFNAGKKKTENDFHVYKRDKNVCASRSFSERVTGQQSDLSGTLVTGDDRALSAAVKNDISGISYNNLGFIYDLKTRKVADSIAVIPIDLNGNGKIDKDEKIYATLDDVLNFLGTSKNKIIPQDNVNIVVNRKTISKNALDFLSWIITQGNQYNHSYGFLNLDKTAVLQEQKLLKNLNAATVLIK